jgi:hypothetical protein
MPRKERNVNSVSRLVSHLKKVIATPKDFINDESLISALKSQGALSKYECANLEIYGTSINTVKRIAESTLEDGFETINLLRIAAIRSIMAAKENGDSKEKTSKSGLSNSLKQRDANIQLVKEDLFTLTMALRKSMNHSANYAKQSGKPDLIELQKRDHRVLMNMFSYVIEKYSNNVIQIK